MKWEEIHDPREEIEIRATFAGSVARFYNPEEIQTLIDEHGTQTMVKMVNEGLRSLNAHNGLLLYNDDGKKILMDVAKIRPS